MAGPDRRARQPSEEELESRKIVNINAETVTNVTSTDFPGHWPGEDNTWDLDKFKQSLKVQFHENRPMECSFSLIGVDASFANAIRRIMISEIETLAIEHVFIEENNSVIQDEVLAHRLGLIPFRASKTGLKEFMRWWKPIRLPDGSFNADPFAASFDYNTIKLDLQIACYMNANAADDEQDPKKRYINSSVYAKDLVFTPMGRQIKYFIGDGAVTPVNPDILLAKLRPGQQIKLECHLRKGIGADHAKFSPVATASYRLLPMIEILSPVVGREQVNKFKACFPAGVIGDGTVTAEEASVEFVKNKRNDAYRKEGEVKAVVANPMLDTVSREVLRHEEFKDKVKLGRKRDHFIFSVESTGQWDADELVVQAVGVLKKKAQIMQACLHNMVR